LITQSYRSPFPVNFLKQSVSLLPHAPEPRKLTASATCRFVALQNKAATLQANLGLA
jgi:hypothetical protein